MYIIKANMEEFMKLYNAYYICKRNLETLENNAVQTINNRTYTFENWGKILRVLQELQSIPYLKKDARAVYEAMPALCRDAKIPEVEHSIKETVIGKIQILINSMITVIDLYESVDDEEKKLGIDIKMPKCENLEEYISYLKDINFIFTQFPYFTNSDETIEFRGTDVGSIWLTFSVIGGTAYILKTLAKLIDSAVVIKSHIVTYKMQEERLEDMKLKKEVGEETLEVFRALKGAVFKEQSEVLQKELGALKNGEEDGKVEKSLEKLTTLLDKGIEFYSSIDAPEDIQALFPALEEPTLLSTEVLKLIEETE